MRSLASLVIGHHVALSPTTRRSLSSASIPGNRAIAIKSLKHELLHKPPSSAPHVSSNITLQQLVQNAHFASAERLRQRMVYYGVPVLLHPVYEQAALDALDLDGDVSLSAFKSWIALYPSRGHPMCPTEDKEILKDTRVALFQRGHPRKVMDSIIIFSYICAQKGLLDALLEETLRVVVHGLERKELFDFLIYLESELPVKDIPKWRGQATKILTMAGYTSEALAMISRKREGRFPLSADTYAEVARAVSGAGEVSHILSQVRERDWRLSVQEGKSGVLGVERGKRKGQWEEKPVECQPSLSDTVTTKGGWLGWAGNQFFSRPQQSHREKIQQNTSRVPRMVFNDPSLSSDPTAHSVVYPVAKLTAVAYKDSLPPAPAVVNLTKAESNRRVREEHKPVKSRNQ